MSPAEMQGLRDHCKAEALDGRYEAYKVSLKFDNPEARLSHGFPIDQTQREVKEMLQATKNDGHAFPELK